MMRFVHKPSRACRRVHDGFIHRIFHGSSPQGLFKDMKLSVHVLVMLANFGDALDRMHDRGVITPAEGFTNFRETLLQM